MARFSRLGALLALGVLAAAACSGSSAPSDAAAVVGPTASAPVAAVADPGSGAPGADGAPIIVGTILDDDNILAPLDHQAHVGFEAAVRQINERGGLLRRPVQVMSVSSESRMSVVDDAARRLVDAGAVLVVVTCELDFAAPAVVRTEEAGVLVISPCGGEKLWGSGAAGVLAFSMISPIPTYGAQIADLLWSEGPRSAGLLWEQGIPDAVSECAGFGERWTELGGTITVEQSLPFLSAAAALADQPNVLAALGDADVVFLCAFQRISTLALSTIREAGVLTPVVGGLTVDNATFRPVDVAGLGDFRLISFASTAGDDPAPAVAAAIDAFRLVDGIPPSSGRFVLGADLATAWAQVVESEQTLDGATLARALRDAQRLSLVSGDASFVGTQALQGRTLRVLVHRDGAMVFDRLWGG